MMNIPKEINRLRSKRWRLNEKYCQLLNDGYNFYSIEVRQVSDMIDELDSKISKLKIGLPGIKEA